MSITREQIKAARNLLGRWQSDLAGKVGVSERAIRLFEGGESAPRLDLAAIRAALEAAGVVFIAEGASVVRRRKNYWQTGIAEILAARPVRSPTERRTDVGPRA
jgi:DNA-binding XRE family transcriptional regulator